MKRCEICHFEKDGIYQINGLVICSACLPCLKLRDLYSIIDGKRRAAMEARKTAVAR